jgi:hypothetical protein
MKCPTKKKIFCPYCGASAAIWQEMRVHLRDKCARNPLRKRLREMRRAGLVKEERP